MTKHNDPHAPLPDILRPTELCDFGDAFARGRLRRRALGLGLVVLGLLALGQFVPQQTLDAALDTAVAATTATPPRD